MNNELDELEQYDKERAEKLLQNIRFLSDLSKFQVRKPNSLVVEMTSMKKWLDWYIAMTEWNGQRGVESEVMNMINSIDNNLRLITERVEVGFELLLSTLQRKDIRIKRLETENEALQKELKEAIERLTPKIPVAQQPTQEPLKVQPVIKKKFADMTDEEKLKNMPKSLW